MPTHEESELLGVGLTWVLGGFPSKARKVMGLKRHEVFATNFYQLKEPMAMGETGLGKGKTCPRDEQPDCSIVDAIYPDNSSRATLFVSWAWAFTLEQMLSALEAWQAQSSVQEGNIYIWWCFFCNNQYRLTADEGSPDELAKIFGIKLVEIGSMLMVVDKPEKPQNLSRLWCIFELWTAETHKVEIQICLSDEGEEAFRKLVKNGSKVARTIARMTKVDASMADASVESDKSFLTSLMKNDFEMVNTVAKEALRRLYMGLFTKLVSEMADEEEGETSEDGEKEEEEEEEEETHKKQAEEVRPKAEEESKLPEVWRDPHNSSSDA